MNRIEFLEVCKIEAGTLEIWIEQNWVVPQGNSAFSEIDVARVNLIKELHHDMGANGAGIDIILHLVDQLHSLRHAMEDARRQLNSAAPPGLKRARRSSTTRPQE